MAKLVPIGQADRQKVQSVIADLRVHRASMTLGGLGWKELRDAGRR